MEVPLAEIELDLAQSIKWRQIAGAVGGKGGLLSERRKRGERSVTPRRRKGKEVQAVASGERRGNDEAAVDITNQRRGDS